MQHRLLFSTVLLQCSDGQDGLAEFLSVTNCYVSLHMPVLHVAGIHVT